MNELDARVDEIKKNIDKKGKAISSLKDELVLLEVIRTESKRYRVAGTSYSGHNGDSYDDSYERWAISPEAAKTARDWQAPEKITGVVLIENTPSYDPQTKTITRHPIQ